MMPALASPNMLRTTGYARNPGNVYVSVSRHFRLEEVAIKTCYCQFYALNETPESQHPCGLQTDSYLQFTHSTL